MVNTEKIKNYWDAYYIKLGCILYKASLIYKNSKRYLI